MAAQKQTQGQAAVAQWLSMVSEAYQASQKQSIEKVACGICGEITKHTVLTTGSTKVMTCRKCGMYRQRDISHE